MKLTNDESALMEIFVRMKQPKILLQQIAMANLTAASRDTAIQGLIGKGLLHPDSSVAACWLTDPAGCDYVRGRCPDFPV
jgi:hypothetical protein